MPVKRFFTKLTLGNSAGHVGQGPQRTVLVVHEGNRAAIDFHTDEIGAVHVSDEAFHALLGVGGQFLRHVLTEGVDLRRVHRAVGTLPLSLPSLQNPGGLRIGAGIWIRGVVGGPAAPAERCQSEEKNAQKSAETKLTAFHDNHSLLFVIKNFVDIILR